jgi:hypothetical protein
MALYVHIYGPLNVASYALNTTLRFANRLALACFWDGVDGFVVGDSVDFWHSTLAFKWKLCGIWRGSDVRGF